MSDPYREASKYNTKIRKIERWYAERIAAITKDRDEQLAAADAELTLEVRAVIEAVKASQKTPGGSADAAHGDTAGEAPSGSGFAGSAQPPGGQIPPRLLEPPPDPAPGSTVVVEDEARKRRRA